MAAILWPNGARNTTFTLNSTQYIGLGQTEISTTTTEVGQKLTVRSAGTFSNLYTRVVSNDTTGTSTLRFRKNTAAGNQTVSVTTAATGEFEDTANTDAVVAGDLVDYQWVISAGGTIFSPTIHSLMFAATTNTYQQFLISGQLQIGDASATYYQPLSSGNGSSADLESSHSYRFRAVGTLKNLLAYVSANARVTASTVNSRVNTANGALTMSIGAGSTGLFEDTTHSDAIVSGDLVCSAIVHGTGTQLITYEEVCVGFETTDGTCQFINEGGAALGNGTGITRYTMFAGRMWHSTFTEVQTQQKLHFVGTLSRLEVHISANGITATTTVRTRKNAANGLQSVSIGSGATGWFEDTTNTDISIASDEWNYQTVTGGTGTTIDFNCVGTLATASPVILPPGFGPLAGQGEPKALMDGAALR